MNLGAVDTVHCMGAGINQAAGFYHAFRLSGQKIPPIIATIGDSTFFHAGLPAVLNAVVQQARFLLVILDNGTTAMTGHQPTPESGCTAWGGPAPVIHPEDLLRATGVRFVAVCDPYDVPTCQKLLQEAWHFSQEPAGGLAVIIARHPCVLTQAGRPLRQHLEVTEDCIACHHCLENFECPALVAAPATGLVSIDQVLCSGCGVCVHVCPSGAIVSRDT